LFKQEDEEQRIKDARKGEARESILSTLGDLASLARPIVDMFLDAMDVAGGLTTINVDGKSDAGFLEAIQDKSGQFQLANAITNGITALLADKDMLGSEVETIKGVSGPED